MEPASRTLREFLVETWAFPDPFVWIRAIVNREGAVYFRSMTPAKRVLIVEDDKAQSETIKALLRRRGIETQDAETLEEGLACARAVRFHCVILDLGLPGSESLDTARRIPDFRSPVVVLTGSDDREIVHEVTKHGAGYVLKGSAATMLMEKVLVRIERAEPSREIREHLVETFHEARQQAPVAEPHRPPWFLQWVPLLSFTVALLGASGTGGMFLYRSISEEAARAKTIEHRLEASEASMREFRTTMESMARVQAELGIKAQTSTDDRANLHREMGSLAQQQRELKDDVVRRLERIEDAQLSILKELGAVARKPR